MKIGRYARIPEGRDDLHALWGRAAHISPEVRPAWLDGSSDDQYRYLGSITCAGEEDRAHYLSELDELELARLLAIQHGRDALRHHLYIERPEPEQVWSIGLYVGPSPTFLKPAVRNPVLTAADVTDVPASYVADPFLVFAGERFYMFFEVLNWRTWKGEIGLATSEDGLAWEYRGIVLAEPFHLSYPYVFSWDDAHWLVPESHQANSVRLYRSTQFPWHWELECVLLEGDSFVDSSVFRHEDRWWLFAQSASEHQHVRLRLFTAEDPRGPWSEHPRSPVVVDDLRLARPGGRIVHSGGQLLRFAQDCQSEYGAAVHAVEISTLTTNQYSERLLTTNVLGPGSGWNAGGMHTLDLHQLVDGRWLACVDGWYMSSVED